MIDMSDIASHAGWLSDISRRVREREIRRQILHNRIRKAIAPPHLPWRFLADRIPVLLPELLKMLMGSLLGLWVISKALAYFFRADPLHTLPVFGLVYSLQASYYKYRLSANPDYKIPKCRCAGRQNDNTEIVLRSRESAILTIPNSVLGVVLYTALLVLVYARYANAAMPVASVAVLVSGYLSYVMVFRIGSLCVNCINVAALNVLVLWQFLR
jgi:uncharacterized membrane protein